MAQGTLAGTICKTNLLNSHHTKKFWLNKYYLLNHNFYKGLSSEDIVRAIQNGMREELTSLKKSLSIDESGPLGVKETARYLKISTQSVYSEIKKGSIPHYQHSEGSKVYFYKNELDHWIRSSKQKSKADIEDEADNIGTFNS